MNTCRVHVPDRASIISRLDVLRLAALKTKICKINRIICLYIYLYIVVSGNNFLKALPSLHFKRVREIEQVFHIEHITTNT